VYSLFAIYIEQYHYEYTNVIHMHACTYKQYILITKPDEINVI